MRDRITAALDQIRAEEGLKARTNDYLMQQIRTGSEKRTMPGRRPAVAILAAACCLVLFVCVAGYRLYFTATSVISIDINPSLELQINRFDRVISVEGYNDDGMALAQQLEIRFLDYQSAIEAILENETVADCLGRHELLSITVVGEDEDQSLKLLQGVQRCTAGQQNVHCHSGNAHEVEAAHQAGLSFGKYQAFLELQALDPSVTAEEAGRMTMREIFDRIAQLTQGVPQGEGSASSSWHGGGHHRGRHS